MGSMELVFSQEYETIKLARQIEFKLKRLKRKDFIEKIIKELCTENLSPDVPLRRKYGEPIESSALVERSPEER